MTPETCIETDRNGLEWHVSADLVPYPEAVAMMEARAARIASNEAAEAIWLLEHPPLYTAGTSAGPQISPIPTASRSSKLGAADNTPITVPASAWST